MNERDEERDHYCQTCCSLGHHVFDRASVLFKRKACRCGKVRGIGPRNRPFASMRHTRWGAHGYDPPKADK